MAKAVLITGAAKRLGAVTASLLHAEGCNIVLHCHASVLEAELLVAQLNARRQNSAAVLVANLLHFDAVETLAQQALTIWGRVDVLINNASMFYPQALADVSESNWDELLGSNLKAPFFLARALATELAARRGCIVNMVDIHAEKGLPGYPVYSIAKAGLDAMTRVLAKELAPEVRVNGVAPGAILWPEQSSTHEQQAILQRIALRTCGDPQDIAKAVRFLCFDADYITGQIIKVDGGRTLFY